jgi:xylulokinase
MEAAAGGAQVVANLTGSRCYCRFTGPQIAKLARVDPQRYARTERVSLVSGFLTSLLLGRVAPTDASDASGMNLLDIWAGDWSEDMLLATRAPELRRRLGRVVPSWEVLGPVSPYASSRYHLPRDAVVVPASGDNPCSLSASPDAPIAGNGSNGLLVVSLGTSDTLIGLTRKCVALVTLACAPPRIHPLN